MTPIPIWGTHPFQINAVISRKKPGEIVNSTGNLVQEPVKSISEVWFCRDLKAKASGMLSGCQGKTLRFVSCLTGELRFVAFFSHFKSAPESKTIVEPCDLGSSLLLLWGLELCQKT